VSDTASNPFLSIIIPAYNEERRLPSSLAKIAEFLRQQPYQSEIVVVENGSTDRTTAVVEQFQRSQVEPGDPFVVLLLHSEKGKGNAVKRGVMAGRGEFLLISDSDLSVPIEETIRFLPPVLNKQHYGVAIASREVPGAVRHGEPFYRHVMGRVYNFLVRILAVPGIQDTQCGFKCFSHAAATSIFPRQRISGWGFDVELIAIAQRQGIPVVEIPVNWYYGAESRVRPIHDTINMVRELMKIRSNARHGIYDNGSAGAVRDEVSAI
jgi:dolichyl-phosphate beta-glucosyltransferase